MDAGTVVAQLRWSHLFPGESPPRRLIVPFEIDLDTGIVLETWTGTLTIEQVDECIQARHAHPDYDESTPRLVDLSEARGNLSPDEIHRLAGQHGSSTYRGRCAFVAPGDLQYGLSRMFVAIVGSARPVAVFRSRERALRWLLDARDPGEREA